MQLIATIACIVFIGISNNGFSLSWFSSSMTMKSASVCVCGPSTQEELFLHYYCY